MSRTKSRGVIHTNGSSQGQNLALTALSVPSWLDSAREQPRGPGPCGLQGYLAHKKQPPSLGPPYGPRHSPTVGFKEGVVYHARGTPVNPKPHTSSLHALGDMQWRPGPHNLKPKAQALRSRKPDLETRNPNPNPESQPPPLASPDTSTPHPKS